MNIEPLLEYDENEAEYDDDGYHSPYCTITGVKDADALPADLEIPNELETQDCDYRVTEIGESAFRGLKKLQSVDIPGSVEEIGTYAFADCERLSSVTLGGSIEYIYENTFLGCNAINEVHIYSLGSHCKTKFKNKYSNPIYLAKDVFFGDSKLDDTLVIPAKYSVTGKSKLIGKYAFCGCKIKELKLSEGIENFKIESEAFAECKNLTTVILPDSLQSFDPTGLREVKTVKYNEYNGLKYLGSETNPYKAVVDICENAPEYKVHPDTEIICNAAFARCSEVKVIRLPAALKQIDLQAFANCNTLNYVILPEDLKLFDPSAARNIESIIYNEYNGLKYLGSETNPYKAVVGFSVKASSYELHPNTDIIGANAFANNTELVELIIPDGVTHVNDCAFSGCNSLKKLYLPSTLEYIGNKAFLDCKSLEQVHVPDAAAWCGITFGSLNFDAGDDINPASVADLYFGNTLAENVIVPQGVEEIKCKAFKSCKTIKTIVLPDGLKHIRSSAFSSCPSLESIRFPDSLETVEACAFCHCKSLKSIYLPPVKFIEWCVFGFCTTLESVKMSVGTEQIARDAFTNCTALKSVEFPIGLKTIGENAFKNCRSLTEANIPDTVTDIGDEAFADCRALRVLHLSTRLISLKSGAFKNCGALETVTIPPITLVGHHAFQHCSSLKSVYFSNGTKEIGCEAFYGCKTLSKIEIPYGVEKIIDSAFKHCTLLREVTLPETLKYIGDYAFAECRLREIKVPNGVTVIERRAFCGCSLERAEIPDSVAQVGYNIFDRCPSDLEVVASDEIKALMAQANKTQLTAKKQS